MPVSGHIYDNGPKVKPFILSEAPGERSRDNVTVIVAGSVIKSGTVLGKVTASGKYKPYSNVAADGSEVAAGVLYRATDAVTGDVKSVILNKDAEFNRFELTGLDTAGEADLLALGIKVRGIDTAGIATPAL
jgi:hypothetical protein